MPQLGGGQLGGGHHRNTAIPFGTEKLEWCDYLEMKKFDDRFSHFDRILTCDQQMDRQMDILRHSPRYA